MTSEFKVHIGIAVPSNGTWRQEFGKALVRLVAYEASASNRQISILTQQSSMLTMSRHKLVVDAIRAKCTHVLFLDTDMTFPRDLVERLLARDKDFIACNCTNRFFPVRPLAHSLDGRVLHSKGKKGVQKVQFVGLAVALIKVDVFKQMTPPFFLQDWVPDLKGYCGEDVYFCQTAKAQIGLDVYVDHGVSQEIGHVGFHQFSHDMTEDNELSEVG